MTDLYEALGVAKDATRDAIKKAFRQKAKAAHPDAGGAPEQFHAIELAHRVLTDDTRRAEYDRTGSTETEPDNFEAAALSIIGSIIDRFLTDEKAKHRDLVAEIRKIVRDEIATAKRNIVEGEKYRTRTQDLQKRVKGKNAAVLLKMFDAKLRDVAGALKNLEDQITVRERALELIDGAEFDVEKMDVRSTTLNDLASRQMDDILYSQLKNSMWR